MKLQNEYKGLIERLVKVDRGQIKRHAEYLREEGGCKCFETRLSWDLLRFVTPTATICSWYEVYDCNDSHITTLAKKACKDLGLFDL